MLWRNKIMLEIHKTISFRLIPRIIVVDYLHATIRSTTTSKNVIIRFMKFSIEFSIPFTTVIERR